MRATASYEDVLDYLAEALLDLRFEDEKVFDIPESGMERLDDALRRSASMRDRFNGKLDAVAFAYGTGSDILYDDVVEVAREKRERGE